MKSVRRPPEAPEAHAESMLFAATNAAKWIDLIANDILPLLSLTAFVIRIASERKCSPRMAGGVNALRVKGEDLQLSGR